MWNITSNNVQRAKERLQLRRAEIETRYAEEKKALDAEFAVIETLERAASEFMLNSTGRTARSLWSRQRRPTCPAAMNKTATLQLSQKRLSWWRRSICPPAANSAAAPRSTLRRPPQRATRWAAAKSAALWTSSNPDRAGGSTAAVAGLILKVSPAMLPPARVNDREAAGILGAEANVRSKRRARRQSSSARIGMARA